MSWGEQMESTGVSGNSVAQATQAIGQPIRSGRFVVKVAESDEELEQLHRLNYQTFVDELPQHAETGNGQLVDKFHDKNTYFVAMIDDHAVGMLAVHDRPPFSIADKMSDPETLLQLGPRPLEVRLMAIDPKHRATKLFAALGYAVFQYARRGQYSHMLISGFVDRLRMYQRIGFRELGPPVRSGGVLFVPMVAMMDEMSQRFMDKAARLQSEFEPEAFDAAPSLVALTPGPAQLSPAVTRALHADQLSHRSELFGQMFARVRRRLASLTGADVALFNGSGTLANDIIAATIAADSQLGKGLVLVNGEFGRRLTNQAARAGLTFSTLQWQWAQPWELDRVDSLLAAHEDIDWVWAVHLESSTGMLNDVVSLGEVVKRHQRRLCLDCTSGLGAVPVDFSDVHLATGVANKSLGGVAGVSMVFAHPGSLVEVDQQQIGPYFDVVDAMQTAGPRFTFPSAPVLALDAALQVYAEDARRAARYEQYAELGRYIRGQLRGVGLPPLVDEPHASPIITTFVLDAGKSPGQLIERCRRKGFAIGGGSGYLRERNWCQLATMGDLSIDDCRPVFQYLA